MVEIVHIENPPTFKTVNKQLGGIYSSFTFFIM